MNGSILTFKKGYECMIEEQEIKRAEAVRLVRESSVALPRCNEMIVLKDGRFLLNRGKKDKPKYFLKGLTEEELWEKSRENVIF
jgi:hypothetical protein